MSTNRHRHSIKSDRRSPAFARAAAAKREGWEFASTYSNLPTPDDRANLEEAFGVESTRAFRLRVASR